jgi:hypothetical protein
MAAPHGYSTVPLTPSAGGVIHAMHGGGSGSPPDNYSGISMIQATGPVDIKEYSGGGETLIGGDPTSTNDPALIAVAAVSTQELNNDPTAATAAKSPMTTEKPTAAKSSTNEAPSSKQITLNGHTITLTKPFDLNEGSKESEALAWFGVDKAADEGLKKEVLQALFDGVCDTDKPLIMVLECEPIRRLVQSLAEKLLVNLTRPVVKKTPAIIASKELQSATLMSFNVFKNQCKTKTAKEYIESSNADIVCTQKDTKTEYTNYTEIKACGADDDTVRVYLKKGIPSAKNIECIVEGANSAVLFTYQDVIIANMGSNDPALLEAVLKKTPHIIVGSVVNAPTGYALADPIKTEQITTDAIWYKADPEVFTLKDAAIPNIIVKDDQYTAPYSCSYSDHNPITAVIEFKNTIKKMLLNSDRAAVAASVEATSATGVGSLAVEAISPSEGSDSSTKRALAVGESGAAALAATSEKSAAAGSPGASVMDTASASGVLGSAASSPALAATGESAVASGVLGAAASTSTPALTAATGESAVASGSSVTGPLAGTSVATNPSTTLSATSTTLLPASTASITGSVTAASLTNPLVVSLPTGSASDAASSEGTSTVASNAASATASATASTAELVANTLATGLKTNTSAAVTVPAEGTAGTIEAADTDTLTKRIAFLEAEPTEDKLEIMETIFVGPDREAVLKDQQNAYASFYTRTTPTSAHVQYKTKNSRNMLDYVKVHLYQSIDDTIDGVKRRVIRKITDQYKQFEKDIKRMNHLTFISDTFVRPVKQEGISDTEYKDILKIINELPDHVRQIVLSLNQYMTETPIGIGMNENDRSGIKIDEYPALFMILPDKIVFHRVSLYKQIMTMNDPADMTPSHFITMFTFEINPKTLKGSIQIDTYDIKGYVKEFEIAHARNFEIASAIAQKRTFMTTLREIFTQKSKRYGPIKVHIDPITREKVSNVYHKSLVENAKRGETYDIHTLYEIIERLELDPKRREEKLAEFDEIKDDHKLLTTFIREYNTNTQMEVEALQKSYDFRSVNEQWYNTFAISPPDIIRTLPTDSYDIAIQQSIHKLITQPDVQKVIAVQFMRELEQRMEYYKKYYDTKSTINKRENDLMIVLRTDNNLSELLERITESRAANANTWLPALSRVFTRRAITGDIDEREKFHDRMRLKSGVVADANATCARAAAYYTLFQTLVNEIGTYLSNKRDIPYTKKPIITVKCDIITTQPIDLNAAADTFLEQIETKGQISPPEVKVLERAVATTIQQVSNIETDALTGLFDDELAKKIAVAAVAVLLEDFEREHKNGAVAAINPDAVVTTVVVDKAKMNAEAAKAETAKAESESEAAAELEASAKAEAEAAAKAEVEAAYKEAEKAEAARIARTEEGSVIKYPPGPGELPPLNSSKKYISQHNSVKESSYRDIIGTIAKERWINKLRIDPVIDRAWKLLNRIDDVGFTLYDTMNRHPDSKKYESELIGYSKNIGKKLKEYLKIPISNYNNKNTARIPLVSAMDDTVMKVTSIEFDLKDAKSNNVASSLPSSSVVSAPTSVAVTKLNALNTFVRANPLSKKRNLRTKNVPPLTNTKKIQLKMKTLSKLIDSTQGHLIDQFKLMKQTTRTKQLQDEIDNLMEKIDDRMTQLNDIYMKDPNIHSETITTFIAECYSLLERINVLTNEIKLITDTNGGKRRTQKKRKQKKRFGSQKKRV